MDTNNRPNGGIIPNTADHPLIGDIGGCDFVIPNSHPLAEAAKHAQIVHLKPDDVIVFSNVGDLDPKDSDVSGLKEALGGRTLVFFPESVDIAILREIEAVVPGHETDPARKTGSDWLYSVEEGKA